MCSQQTRRDALRIPTSQAVCWALDNPGRKPNPKPIVQERPLGKDTGTPRERNTPLAELWAASGRRGSGSGLAERQGSGEVGLRGPGSAEGPGTSERGGWSARRLWKPLLPGMTEGRQALGTVRSRRAEGTGWEGR